MKPYQNALKHTDKTPLEPIPVGEVKESDWAEWADSVGFQDSEPTDFQITDKVPISRAEGDSIDVFASVTQRSK